MENLWSIFKSEVYAGGKQFSSKEDLWSVIKITANGISSDTIKKLITLAMDQRLLSVVTNHRRYINNVIAIFFVVRLLNALYIKRL